MADKNRKKIKYRAPYEIPTASDYKFAVARFIKRVEFRLKHKNKELKHLGADLENCEKYLNSMIDTEFATRLRKYKKIYNSDCIQLEDAIERRRTDKEDYFKLLSDIKTEIASLSAEYIAIEKLYENNFNSLYKGHLKVDEEGEDFTKGEDVDE